jgi:type II secretory pathway component PulJ
MNRMLRTSSRTRGFTAMELMLGMIITSLVMVAITGLTTAVGRGWTHCNSAQATSNAMVQSHVRLLRILKAARQIGTTRQGSLTSTAGSPAAVMLWKGDANRDDKTQFSELAMIEYSSSDKTLLLYEVEYPSNWTSSQKTTADTPALDDDDIYDPNVIDTFKGMNYVTSAVLVKSVSGVQFRKIDSSSTIRPALEYLLNIERNATTTETEYGSVAIRVPATMPVSQR